LVSHTNSFTVTLRLVGKTDRPAQNTDHTMHPGKNYPEVHYSCVILLQYSIRSQKEKTTSTDKS